MECTVQGKKEARKPAGNHVGKVYNKWLLIRHYALRGHISRILITGAYFRKNKKRKLQVGCGYNCIDEWLNGDLWSGDIYLNAKRRMPFKSKSFDFIFSEHFIEHLEKGNGLKFLNDCYRILKDNGIIRIVSPDLEKIIDIYYDRNQYVKRQTLMEAYGKGTQLQPCELFNDYMHEWGHKFIYDKQMIASALASIGFVEITFCDYKKSNHSELRDLEKHLEEYTFLNPAETFIVEARRNRNILDDEETGKQD
jgi:predicted SAM-dependent methyltransferase